MVICLAIMASLCTSTYAQELWSPEPEYYTCFAMGDPHYHTFDGSWINFEGKCKYLLAGTCKCTKVEPFHVYVTNKENSENSDVTFTNDVEINIAGHVIVFSADNPHVLIDGFVPYSWEFPHIIHGVGTVLCLATSHYEFVSYSGITVTYQSNHMAQVAVPCKYMDEMCGICGNLNLNPADDCVTSRNENVCGNSEEGSLIGDSWQVLGGGPPCIRIPFGFIPPGASTAYCSFLQNSAAPTAVQTLTFPRQQVRAITVEDIDVINTPPIHNTPVSPIASCVQNNTELAKLYYDACEYDVSFTGSHCEMVEAFVKNVCESRATGWRNFFDCPFECPDTMVYSEDVPACPLRCPQSSSIEQELTDCARFVGEGCVCPPGHFLLFDECVQNCAPTVAEEDSSK